ncbi:MAG TPA: hypothetical protein VER76_08145 [Pyrinomonadaceae bacterium]|nr:hypothetical protein [Pyrinomonadaceae bacterium]
MSRTVEQTHMEMEGSNAAAVALVCPACGAAARRACAHFCATCGRGLRERTYAPADALLASYHQQHSRPAMLFEPEPHAAGVVRRSAPRLKLPPDEGNTSAAIALVLVFCSLVPFYGIMFSPLVVVIGGFGRIEAWLFRRMGGARLAVACIGFGLLIAGVQVLVWSYVSSYL